MLLYRVWRRRYVNTHSISHLLTRTLREAGAFDRWIRSYTHQIYVLSKWCKMLSEKTTFHWLNFHLSYHFRECGFCRQQRSQVGRYNALQGRDVLKGAAHQQRDAAGSLLYFFVPYSQKPRSFCSACRTRASTYSDRWRVTKFIRTQVIYYKKKTLLIIPCAFHLKNKLSAKRIKQWQCIFFPASNANETFLATSQVL